MDMTAKKDLAKGGRRKVAGIFCLAFAALLAILSTLMLVESVGSHEMMAELGILYGVITAIAALIAAVTGAAFLRNR